MIHIPQIGLEQFAGSHRQIPVERLSHTVKEAFDNVFDDFLLIDLRQFHVIDLTIEISLFFKDQ